MSTQAERAERARRGSRRQRDLEALAAEQTAALDAIAFTDRAAEAWQLVLDTAAADSIIRPCDIETWLRPVRPGEADGALVLAAEPRVASWLRARYGSWIGYTLQLRGAPLRGVRVIEEPQS